MAPRFEAPLPASPTDQDVTKTQQSVDGLFFHHDQTGIFRDTTVDAERGVIVTETVEGLTPCMAGQSILQVLQSRSRRRSRRCI